MTGYAVLPELTDPDWRVVGTGRFDADGWPDILWRNHATGANVVWFMMGAAFAGFQVLAEKPDLEWAVAGVCDWNRDGRADILWRNLVSGANLSGTWAACSILRRHPSSRWPTRCGAPLPSVTSIVTDSRTSSGVTRRPAPTAYGS